MEPTIFNEHLSVINVETPKYEIFHWEANGYDDSDGGYMYYIPEFNGIYHDEWTTRAAGRYLSEAEKLLNKKETLQLQEGLDSGAITEQEVMDALIKYEDIKPGICLDALKYTNRTLNIEVTSNRGQGFRGVGNLIEIKSENKRNYWGESYSSYYAIIYKPSDNTIYCTKLNNVDITDNGYETFRSEFAKQAKLNDIIKLTRAKYYQFDYNPYTREPYYSYQQYSIDAIKDNLFEIDLSTAIDKTAKKVSKHPAHIEKINRYKEDCKEKYIKYLNWAKSLEKIDGYNSSEELAYHTTKKYCGDKLIAILADEPDFNLIEFVNA